MSSSTLTQLVTYDDYRHLPDDGKQYQIIEGELYMTPAPTTEHQRISINLSSILHGYVSEHQLGKVFHAPVDVVLSMTDVVQPDILFVAKERQNIITRKNIVSAPDLVIKILSESTVPIDRKRKKELYLRHGVKEYWIVNPETRAVEQLILRKNKYEYSTHSGQDTFASPTIEGLIITADEVFM